MSEKENTHIVLTPQGLIISPNLSPIIRFLQEIEQEVGALLNLEKNYEQIRLRVLDTWKFIQFLSNKLKENAIDFKYTLSDHPDNLAKFLNPVRPIRFEMIGLFAYIETLNCFNVVYKESLDPDADQIIITKAKGNLSNFLNTYCLSKNNQWVKDNPQRAKKINAAQVKKLRNTLTHFFSLGKTGLNIAHSGLDEKSRKLEKLVGNNVVFLSPDDLYEITKSAAQLMIREWSNDCQQSIANSDDVFERRIKLIRTLVINSGAVIVRGIELDI
jgi:hypothetical protein